MSAIRNAIRGLTTFACATLLVSLPATAKEFSYSARQNDRLAKLFAADAVLLKPGQSIQAIGYTLTLDKIEPGVAHENYTSTRATLRFDRGGQTVLVLHPERRFFALQQTVTTEAAITTTFLRDIYATLGEQRAEQWIVRVQWRPLVAFIWIGALTMAFGGLVSLSDRRFRLGAPVRARARGDSASRRSIQCRAGKACSGDSSLGMTTPSTSAPNAASRSAR